MPKVKYRWTAIFETIVDVDDINNVDMIRDEGANINIPEDEHTKYEVDTWEIQSVTDMYGNEINH